MGVTFVIGRAGSGKTARIVTRIVEAVRADPLGPPIFWLFPKQATFQAERELTCALGAFSRVRVVSFDLLGRMIAQEMGGSAVPEVTELGRRMIIGHLLRRHQTELRFFGSVAHRPGLAAELDATFAEFERSGKTTADLADLLDQLRHTDPADSQGPSLQLKLRDVSFLYDAYTRYLGQDRLDPHRRLMQVLEKIEQCPMLRPATVFVDGFAVFRDTERRMLVGMAKTCRSLEIALVCDPDSPTVIDPHHLPDELNLFHRTEQTFRKLWFAMTEDNITVHDVARLTGASRFKSSELARIERSIFAMEKDEPPSSCAFPAPVEAAPIRFIECPDLHAEVEAAAREVRSLLKAGCRLRDIVILVRDLPPYQPLIDAIFPEHGISWFIDRRRPADHHPLVQFIRSLFQIARGGWPQPAVMGFLKSGLAGVTLLEADEFENYLIQHRLRGSAWDDPADWTYQRRAPEPESDAPPPEVFETRSIDQLRRLIVQRITPLAALMRGERGATVRELAGEVFAVLERFGVRATLEQWMSKAQSLGDLEQRGEHEQVWAEAVNLFEQMVELLGEEQVSPADFVDVLESGLERFDLALTPPTLDQVLVGQVDRTRTPAVRAAVVMGMSDGIFPGVARDTSIISHAERRELGSRKIELDPDPHRRQLDERLLGYIAFTRASEYLIVTRPRMDASGRETQPSPFWQELRELMPHVPVTWLSPDRHGDIRHVATPRQLVSSLMQWAREPNHGESSSPGALPRLYQWLATYPINGDSMDTMRSRAWKALGYRNHAQLSPLVAKVLYPAPLRSTARQLEIHAACPFQHYARFGLRLRGRATKDLSAADMSQVFHEVLEIVVKDVLGGREDWRDLSAEAAGELVRAYSQAIAGRLRGEVMLSTARNAFLLQRIEKTLEQVLASVREMLSRGTLRPMEAGVSFGEKGRLPPCTVVSPGGGVALSGRIDRVDLIEDSADARTAMAVFDYQLAAGTLSIGAVCNGLSLQLLTYLLVLEANGRELIGRPVTPAAAFALQLLRGMQNVDHPDEALDPADPLFLLRSKPRGVFDERYFSALDTSAAPGTTSKVVQARLKKDGHLGHRDQSDAADPADFSMLLAFVRGRIGQIADEIMAGRTDVSPFRIGRTTPCPRCDFRAVCRFEPAMNGYRHLPSLKRGAALDRIAGRATDER